MSKAVNFNENKLPRASQELPALDGLRAIAILLVVMCHVWGSLGGPQLQFGILNLTPLANFGKSGVILFFGLSGFLIVRSARTLRDRRSFWVYAKRRIFRIAPAYFVCIFILSCYLVPHPSAMHVISHVFFVHTLADSTFWTISGAFWSLGPEIQFYVFIALIVKLTALRDPSGERKFLFKSLLAFASLSVILRVILVRQDVMPDAHQILYSNFPALADAFLLGGSLSLVPWSKTCLRNPAYIRAFKIGIDVATLAFIYGICIWVYSNEYHVIRTGNFIAWNNLVIAAAYTLLIYASLQSGSFLNYFLSLEVFRNLGKISFGIFLWHLAIIDFNLPQRFSTAMRFGPLSFVSSLCIVGILSILAGTLSYWFVEKPFIRLSHLGPK